MIIAIHCPLIVTFGDGSSIIESAHAAGIIHCTSHCPRIVTIGDGSILIVSAHAADIIRTLYIRIGNTNILNGCIIYFTKQSNTALIFIVKIQSADGMSLTVECAFVINTAVSNRRPWSYACGVGFFCHFSFVYNDVIHQNSVCFCISCIDIFHEPVELFSVADSVIPNKVLR